MDTWAFSHIPGYTLKSYRPHDFKDILLVTLTPKHTALEIHWFSVKFLSDAHGKEH